MAENEDGTEKTEQPTGKRLREAREKGNVAQSRELSTATLFVAAVLALYALSGHMGAAARHWMKAALAPDPALLQTPDALFGHAGWTLLKLALAFSPLVLVCLAASFVAPVVMGGLRFSNQALMPSLDRLNPMNGIKRIYGPESLAELTKSMLRIVFVGGAVALVVWQGIGGLRSLLRLPLESAIHDGLGFTLRLLLAAAGAMALLAAIDAPYQKWNWLRKLKMTREEVKREMKESEGSPEVKGRIRQMQMQMSQRRMMEAVPTADVVLVNPTHYAVALKYEAGRMNAPTVVARGVDELALRIRQVADGNRVTIVSAPPLARALYRESQLGKEIPVRLYSAVAQVLSYVYQLRTWRSGPMPAMPALDVDEYGKGARR